jgi:hypothetical protein
MSSVPSKFTGYAAKNAEDGKQNKVEPIEFEPTPLGVRSPSPLRLHARADAQQTRWYVAQDDDVTVQVEYCGVCFSDIHVMHQDVRCTFLCVCVRGRETRCLTITRQCSGARHRSLSSAVMRWWARWSS